MRTVRNVILIGLLLWCCATYREYQGKPTPVKDSAEMMMVDWQAESHQGLVGQERVLFKKEQGLFKNERGLFKNERGLFKKNGRHETLLPF